MQIKAPDLGVESAEVSEILVAVGDEISTDDNIVLLESDKASVEVPSSASGKITKINVAVGDMVSEGSVLIELEATANGDSAGDSSEPTQSSKDTDPDTESNNETETNNKNSADQSPSESSDDFEAQDKAANNANNASKENGNTNSSSQNNDETGEGSTETYSLPDLGVDEAEVAEIMVSVGDTVEAEQSLLLMESDKASVEVPAPVAGKIEKILISAGDTVKNKQDFIVINVSNGSNNSSSNEKNKASDSNSDSEKKTENESKNKPKESQETAKSSNTQPKKSAKDESLDRQVGNNRQKLTESEVNAKMTDVYAGPAVRKLARQLGVDITQVDGSALNDRILKEDVFGYVKAHMKEERPSDSTTTSGGRADSGLPSLPDMSNANVWGEIDTQNLSRLQKVSIPQLNYNTYLPQVTQFDLADITDTEKLRKELKPEFKVEGIGLTILAFIVKATAYALTQYPRFNSHLSDDNTQILIRKSINMGIAVATEEGLIVPVIKEVQNKGIKQIAIEIGELAGKARDKKLSTKDLQGASFTISSQGNLGGTYFTPLVNWPQVGILGVSEASMQPRWNAQSQNFEPRLMLPLSLSYDHRVINGADAAVFTRYVAKLLTDPRRILL